MALITVFKAYSHFRSEQAFKNDYFA